MIVRCKKNLIEEPTVISVVRRVIVLRCHGEFLAFIIVGGKSTMDTL